MRTDACVSTLEDAEETDYTHPLVHTDATTCAISY